jgi:hypothetical protein
MITVEVFSIGIVAAAAGGYFFGRMIEAARWRLKGDDFMHMDIEEVDSRNYFCSGGQTYAVFQLYWKEDR